VAVVAGVRLAVSLAVTVVNGVYAMGEVEAVGAASWRGREEMSGRGSRTPAGPLAPIMPGPTTVWLTPRRAGLTRGKA